MRSYPFRNLAAVLLLCGCHAVRPAPVVNHAADEQEIRSALAQSAASWNSGDLKGHLAYYADSVTFMTQNGPRVGVEPIAEAFARKYFNNGRPKQTLGFDELLVRFPARDVALVTGRFTLTGGGEAEQSGHFTLVWSRESGRWKCVHDHSS